MSNWTDDKPARLRIMWAEGQSTRTISNELGFTRNAVVGKAHRRSPASRDLQAQKRLCITGVGSAPRSVEIIFSGDSDEREKPVPPRIGQRGSHARGRADIADPADRPPLAGGAGIWDQR